MADNVMMNEGALQQQGFREKDYQEEILRLRGQLVASQQAKRLAMEQLAVQRPSVTPMVEQLSATSIPPTGQGAQQLGLIAPAPCKRLPDISKFDGSRKGYPMWKVEADNKLRIDGRSSVLPKIKLLTCFQGWKQRHNLWLCHSITINLVVMRLPLFGILIVFTLIRTQQRAL